MPPDPAPGRDLCTEDDVRRLVTHFYGDVAQDGLLGPVFNDVAAVDWPTHLATLTAFWSRLLFGTPGYRGNPFRAHQTVHRQHPFTSAHFQRWLDLFDETLDADWAGPNVERVRALARDVARVHCRQLVGPSPLSRDPMTRRGSGSDSPRVGDRG